MPKRVTDKQVAANRANAKKSTGPKGRAGKAAVALNAVRHGLYASALLLPNDPEAAEFDALLEGLRDQLKPAGILEDLIIQRIATAHWRLRRAYRFEAEAIQKMIEWRPDTVEFIKTGLIPEPPNAHLPGSPDFNRLIRYEALIERELSHAMAQLDRLTRARAATLPEPAACEPPSPHDPLVCTQPGASAIAQPAPIQTHSLAPHTTVDPHAPTATETAPASAEPSEIRGAASAPPVHTPSPHRMDGTVWPATHSRGQAVARRPATRPFLPLTRKKLPEQSHLLRRSQGRLPLYTPGLARRNPMPMASVANPSQAIRKGSIGNRQELPIGLPLYRCQHLR